TETLSAKTRAGLRQILTTSSARHVSAGWLDLSVPSPARAGTICIVPKGTRFFITRFPGTYSGAAVIAQNNNIPKEHPRACKRMGSHAQTPTKPHTIPTRKSRIPKLKICINNGSWKEKPPMICACINVQMESRKLQVAKENPNNEKTESTVQ